MTAPRSGGRWPYAPKVTQRDIRAALDAQAAWLNWSAGGRARNYPVQILDVLSEDGYCERCGDGLTFLDVEPEGEHFRYDLHMRRSGLSVAIVSALRGDGVAVRATAHRSVGGIAHDWLTDVVLSVDPGSEKGSGDDGANAGV